LAQSAFAKLQPEAATHRPISNSLLPSADGAARAAGDADDTGNSRDEPSIDFGQVRVHSNGSTFVYVGAYDNEGNLVSAGADRRLSATTWRGRSTFLEK
jgi:hypothetical protein